MTSRSNSASKPRVTRIRRGSPRTISTDGVSEDSTWTGRKPAVVVVDRLDDFFLRTELADFVRFLLVPLDLPARRFSSLRHQEN